ncbi:hypothetical protein JHK87_033619 [Glycine soja]|nr:hypothetical protein JHK87_033619 [Glycine soja]
MAIQGERAMVVFFETQQISSYIFHGILHSQYLSCCGAPCITVTARHHTKVKYVNCDSVTIPELRFVIESFKFNSTVKGNMKNHQQPAAYGLEWSSLGQCLGQGLGKALIEKLIRTLLQRDIGNITLFAYSQGTTVLTTFMHSIIDANYEITHNMSNLLSIPSPSLLCSPSSIEDVSASLIQVCYAVPPVLRMCVVPFDPQLGVVHNTQSADSKFAPLAYTERMVL